MLRLRLCFIADAKSIHVQRWLSFFVERGHEVHLLTREIGLDMPGVIQHVVLPRVRWPKTRLAQTAWQIRRIVRCLQPSVLHAISAGWPGWCAALTGYHPFVLSLWGGDVLADQGAYDTMLQRLLTPFALRHCDYLIAQSPHLLDVVRRFAVDGVPQRTIPIGVDCKHFQPLSGCDTYRDRLDIPEYAPIVLSPRHTLPLYNIDLIIQAIPLVLQRHPMTIFVFKEYYLPDSTGYQEACKALTHQLGVASNTRWVPALHHREMPHFYACADIAVSVAKSDGLPVSVLEAMACGLPLVLSPLVGLQSYLSQGENALYVKPVEPEAIATAINALLDDEALRTLMGQANRTLALAKFDFVPIMETVEALYRKLSTKVVAK